MQKVSSSYSWKWDDSYITVFLLWFFLWTGFLILFTWTKSLLHAESSHLQQGRKKIEISSIFRVADYNELLTMALILGLSCGELSLYPNVDLLFGKKVFCSHSRTIILTKTWHGTQCCWWVQLYFIFNICVGEAHSCWCGLMLSSHTLPQGDRVTTLVSCLSHVLSEVHRERYRGIVAHSSMYSLFYISPTQVIPQKNIWIEVYVGKNIGCRALMENLCHL